MQEPALILLQSSENHTSCARVSCSCGMSGVVTGHIKP